MVAAHAIVSYRVRTSGSSLALIPGFFDCFPVFCLALRSSALIWMGTDVW